MDRREFLRTTGAAAAAATSATAAAADSVARSAVPGPARATGTTELRLSMPWPDNGQGYGDSGRRLARRIEALAEGRFRIVISTGGEIDDGDLIHGMAHDHASHHAAFAYFAGLPGPGGLSPQDLEAWVSIGGGQALWDDLGRDIGLKPLLAGHSGSPPLLWSKSPLSGLSDFAGQKVYAPGLAAEVARALGAEPISPQSGDVVRSLADGDVRFVEWGGALQSLALGLHRAATQATGSGLNGNGTALSLSVRLSVWERMSAADQALLATAAAAEYRTCLSEQRAHDSIIRSALSQAHAVVFSPCPADVADAISRVADATTAHVAARDARSARVNHSYMAFRAATAGTESTRAFLS